MIDHNPQYEIEARERENGFRDATASQLRELRDDMESRYRESQTREKWINPSVVDRTSHVTPIDREKYEEIGEIMERSENRNRNTDSLRVVYNPPSTGYVSTPAKGSVWDFVFLFALATFAFFLFQFIVAL